MLTVVDSKHGRIIVPSEDAYVGRSLVKYGEFSRGEAELFEQLIKPGMVVADIGANFGAHTLVFAKRASKVYAVEPQRMVYYALCGTLALNLAFNVTPVNAAIGAIEGFVGEIDLDFDHYNNSGGIAIEKIDPKMVTYEVPLVRFTTPCHFMKIDVEGMEEQVLRGSEEMIRQCMPFLYVENDRKDKADSLIDYILHLGYDAYWHYTDLFSKNNYFNDQEDIFPGLGSLNVLCVPKGAKINGLEPVTTGIHPGYTYTL
jgi:FkbM family methyltransferase